MKKLVKVLVGVIVLMIFSFGIVKADEVETKISIRFPFGLTAGISYDSVKTIMTSKGYKRYKGLGAGIIAEWTNYNNTRLSMATTNFSNVFVKVDKEYGLYYVTLRGIGGCSVEGQCNEIIKLISFIKETYLGKVTYVKEINYGRDLMDETIFNFDGDDFSLFIYSAYDAGTCPFDLRVIFYNDVIFSKVIDREKEEQQEKEKEQKKNL